MNKQTCSHCLADIAIRNPTGYCDHLYYPNNCVTCKLSIGNHLNPIMESKGSKIPQEDFSPGAVTKGIKKSDFKKIRPQKVKQTSVLAIMKKYKITTYALVKAMNYDPGIYQKTWLRYITGQTTIDRRQLDQLKAALKKLSGNCDIQINYRNKKFEIY